MSVHLSNVSIHATCVGHRDSPWEQGTPDGPHASHCLAALLTDARMPAARACVDLAVAGRVAARGCRRCGERSSLASVWAVWHRRRAGRDRQSASPSLAGERRPYLRVWRVARQRARGALRSLSHVPGVRAPSRRQWTDVAGRPGCCVSAAASSTTRRTRATAGRSGHPASMSCEMRRVVRVQSAVQRTGAGCPVR